MIRPYKDRRTKCVAVLFGGFIPGGSKPRILRRFSPRANKTDMKRTNGAPPPYGFVRSRVFRVFTSRAVQEVSPYRFVVH